MRTAVLTLCALMPAGGQEIFARRWDKPAAPRTDRRKALWNELGDLNSSQLRRQAYFAEVALNKCKQDRKKAKNNLDKWGELALGSNRRSDCKNETQRRSIRAHHLKEFTDFPKKDEKDPTKVFTDIHFKKKSVAHEAYHLSHEFCQ